ncbi:MAG: 50S ribosomal protein L6 [Candidatus Kerfeldbacteria bacterium]|nr:50S ribosomal protein L6 [Candidatus Kerfeldbacteria bacterium]
MSRIGRLPIPIPDGVTLTVSGQTVSAKGPKGELSLPLHEHVTVEVKAGAAAVTVAQPDVKDDRALWGLFRVLIQNMVTGVTKGFEKRLEVQGVGYRAEAGGKTLKLFLGFSHPVAFPLPEGVEAKVEKNVIVVTGIDKQLVGAVAADIRSLRKPEPYKGKGIRYVDEVVRRKAGKVVKAAGAGS